MSYQVLARKWRPKKFQEIIGQEHITRSLQNALKDEKFGHAYLFTGTRGIGKTSIARIFAKALRCESRLPDGNPCCECETCKIFSTDSSLDVVEIDGASNNSVDNIRELISNVQYLPTKGRFRVYIVDEVHMLSASAFNALLKTIEEPPEHVKFLFATTEPQKLLGTVLSRCQRFEFKNAKLKDLLLHVKMIAEVEKISFESDEIVTQICKGGNGSVRDTLSLLDQVLSYTEDSHITEDALVLSMGVAKLSVIQKIAAAMFLGDELNSAKLFNETLMENVPAKNIAMGLLDYFYNMIIKQSLPEGVSRAEGLWIYEVIAKETPWILESLLPNESLELLIRKISLRREILMPADLPQEKKTSELKEELPPVKELVEEVVKEEKNIEKFERTWDGFLEYLFEKSPATASNLEQGNILTPFQFDGSNVALRLGFTDDAVVFLEYLQEDMAKTRLISFLATFFEVKELSVSVALEYVDEEVRDQSNFESKAEIKDRELEEKNENKRQSIVNHPMVKEAEKLFNSRVDKVVLGKTDS